MPAANGRPRPTARPLLALCAFAGLAAVARWNSFGRPVSPDGGAYLYIGHLVLHGGIPYVDAIDNKGPVTYALFALLRLGAGTSDMLVRIAFVGIVALAALAIAAYVARTAGRRVGVAAGAVFSVLASGPWQGSSVNTEELGVAPMAAAWWLATGSGVWSAAGAGALASLASLMNVGFVVIVLPVTWELCRSAPGGDRFRRLAAALAGAVTVALPFLAWLAARHALGPMVHEFLGYGGGAVTGHLAVPSALSRRIAFPHMWLVLAGALGALLGRRSPHHRAAANGALIWLIAMIGRAKLSPYDGPSFAHHYYPIIPGVAVGLTLGAATLLEPGRRPFLPVRWTMVTAAGISMVAVSVLLPALRGKDERSRISAAASFVQAHTAPSARIIVSGYAPQIYRFAKRDAAAPLFAVPRFGAVSRAGNYRTEYRRTRLRTLLARPPAAVVMPGDHRDDDLRVLLYLVPYRRAFRTCDHRRHNNAPGCSEVWLVGSAPDGPRVWSAQRINRVLARLGRDDWDPRALRSLRDRPHSPGRDHHVRETPAGPGS